MEYKEDVTARVKELADIVQVIGEHISLKKSGARFLGLCPFHGEKTPSFSVHPGQQFFHCFGCGESGDVFSFIMKHQGVDFPEALKILAARYNIELPEKRRTKEEEERSRKRKELFTVTTKVSGLFCEYLQSGKNGQAARDYLQQRGVSHEIVKRFQIGYAPSAESEGWNYLGSRLTGGEAEVAIEAGLLVKKERGGTYDRFRDRIMFPVFDISGRVCGFGGRIVGEGQPKYMNSPESMIFNKSGLLFGLYQQKDHIRKQNRTLMVEGNFDLISLVAGGCENAVAPLGTALTREQLRMLKRFAEEVTLLFDGDAAGTKAAVRAVPLFLAEGIAGRVALLPPEHDPDTFIREFGSRELTRLVESGEELPEFMLSHLIGKYGLGLDGKRRIVDELQPLLKAAVSPLQRSVIIAHFAEKLGLTPGQLEVHFDQSALQDSHQDVKSVEVSRDERVTVEQRMQPLSMAQKQLLEYMILNPADYNNLNEHGIRDCLAGTIGEILFLELGRLLRSCSSAEPEELLTLLPDGQERTFVANLLVDSSRRITVEEDEGQVGELDELLIYLKQHHLKKSSDTLMAKIKEAQLEGDQELLLQLLSEQVVLNKKFHEEEISGSD